MTLASFIAGLPSVVIIVGTAFFMSLLSTVVYKLVTDQDKMKSVQRKQKQLRKDMQKYRDNPDKMMKLQKQAMEINMEVFPQTMKSMMVTLLPLLLIFNWLGATVAYNSIAPGQPFNTTVVFENQVSGQVTLTSSEGIDNLSPGMQQVTGNAVSWTLKGEEGEHTLEYTYGNETYSKDLLISESGYSDPALTKQKKLFFLIPVGDGIPADSSIKTIQIDYQPVKPLGKFSLFGWRPGWLATYMVSSLLFSLVLRKVLKVY